MSWFSPILHKFPLSSSMCECTVLRACAACVGICVGEKLCASAANNSFKINMYCAYPVPGMGSNSLMYYYNGKTVSLFLSSYSALLTYLMKSSAIFLHLSKICAGFILLP